MEGRYVILAGCVVRRARLRSQATCLRASTHPASHILLTIILCTLIGFIPASVQGADGPTGFNRRQQGHGPAGRLPHAPGRSQQQQAPQGRESPVLAGSFRVSGQNSPQTTAGQLYVCHRARPGISRSERPLHLRGLCRRFQTDRIAALCQHVGRRVVVRRFRRPPPAGRHRIARLGRRFARGRSDHLDQWQIADKGDRTGRSGPRTLCRQANAGPLRWQPLLQSHGRIGLEPWRRGPHISPARPVKNARQRRRISAAGQNDSRCKDPIAKVPSPDQPSVGARRGPGRGRRKSLGRCGTAVLLGLACARGPGTSRFHPGRTQRHLPRNGSSPRNGRQTARQSPVSQPLWQSALVAIHLFPTAGMRLAHSAQRWKRFRRGPEPGRIQSHVRTRRWRFHL